MIMAAVENFVIFSTALSVTAVFVVWAIRAGSSRRRANPRFMSRACTAALLVPPAGAAWVVTAALLPAAWLGGGDRAADHHVPAESVHLIQEITGGIEPFLGYAVMAMVSITFAAATIATLRSYRRTAWAIRRLSVTHAHADDPHKVEILEAAARRHGIDVTVLGSDRPLSFVTGWGPATVAVSTGTLRALSVPQLVGVVEHELAHHERRDNRVGFALRLIAALSLAGPATRALLRWRSEQVELLCDEIATSRTSAPLDIAEALVVLGRAAAPTPVMAVASFIPEDQSMLARRVRRLVQLADDVPAAAVGSATPSRRAVVATVLTFSASLVAVTAWAPFAVHTATESLLGFFK
jgi:Zn-dependent protease with chaperone function